MEGTQAVSLSLCAGFSFFYLEYLVRWLRNVDKELSVKFKIQYNKLYQSEIRMIVYVGMCFETKPIDFYKFCNTSSHILITNLISYSFRNFVSMIEILDHRQIISPK